MKWLTREVIFVVVGLVALSAVVAAVMVVSLANWGKEGRPPLPFDEAMVRFPAYFAVIWLRP